MCMCVCLCVCVCDCVWMCVVKTVFFGASCWWLMCGVLQCLQIPAKANKPQLVFLWSSPESSYGSLSLGLQFKESTCFAVESDLLCIL